jgi:mRNA interferase RelE/StbE
MASYSVYFKESVQKDFGGIPKKELRKILTRIRSLGGNPRPQGCEKLTGRDRYRVRQGSYRIVYFNLKNHALRAWSEFKGFAI